MKAKHIILLILPLLGLALFGFPLVRYWYSGLDMYVVLATVIGLPMIGLFCWLRSKGRRRLIAAVKAGKSPSFSTNILEGFIFFIIIFIAVLVFNTFPVYFFLSFVYATMIGGFAWWFFRTWLLLKAIDEKESASEEA